MNAEENEKMFRLEGQLWWYRSLHERVELALHQHFGGRKDITILDAGCGTGGLLDFLRQRGYTNLRGVDGAADAVAFCHERGLSVTLVDLNELAGFEPDIQYDALICNDVFCYFADPGLSRLLINLKHRLKPNGILVSNNNAFNAFSGQHDVAVGSTRRFVLADFRAIATQSWIAYWVLYVLEFCPVAPDFDDAAMAASATEIRLAQTGRGPVRCVFARRVAERNVLSTCPGRAKLFRRTPFGSSLFMVVSKYG